MEKWAKNQPGAKFEQRYWLQTGNFALPLYLNGQVPPNELRLTPPDPEGSPIINVPTEAMVIKFHIDYRHLVMAIESEMKELKVALKLNKGQSTKNVEVIDLTEDIDYPPGHFRVPHDKNEIAVNFFLEFCELTLRQAVMFDWNNRASYYIAPSFISDMYQKVKTKFLEEHGLLGHSLPSLIDLMYRKPTQWVKIRNLQSTFEKIKERVSNFSRVISNMGFRHPQIFDLLEPVEDFKK